MTKLIDISSNQHYVDGHGTIVKIIGFHTQRFNVRTYRSMAGVNYTADGRVYPVSDITLQDLVRVATPDELPQPLILEIGKSYLNGYGQRRTIAGMNERSRFVSEEQPFWSYLISGAVDGVYPSRLDLVSEYTDDESTWGIEIIPGHIYYDTQCNDVTLTLDKHKSEDSEYIYLGSNGMRYTNEGRIYTDPTMASPLDLIGPSPTKVLLNNKTYAPYDKPNFISKEFTLQVDAIMDAAPGTWDSEDDLMRWITDNPYVRRVTLVRT